MDLKWLISELKSSTCYSVWFKSTLKTGSRIETKNSTYCTLPKQPPVVLAAYIQNSLLRYSSTLGSLYLGLPEAGMSHLSRGGGRSRSHALLFHF